MTTQTLTEKLSVTVAENQLELFVESDPYFASLVNDIRGAQKRAWLEAYIVADDAAGRAVAEALKERAAAGVDCRVIYDAYGTYATPSRFFDEMSTAGVKVRAFRPFGRLWHRWGFFRTFNRRTHRKLAIIDDEVAYFGGMNVVDQGGSAAPPLSKAEHPVGQAAWRDVHVRLQGASAATVAAAFNDLWERDDDLRSAAARPRRRNPTARDILSADRDAIFFFDSRPHVRHRRPGPIFKALLGGARQSITLAMAYFLPFGGVLRALLKARKRGATVQVIMPSQSDVRLVQWAARHMYERLLRHGIRIYERRDRMLHSKMLIVDGTWSVIGSCNLDPRSLLLNLEFFAVVRSAELAKLLAGVCRYERRHSDPVRLSQTRKRRWWERLLHYLAWTFRRWL